MWWSWTRLITNMWMWSEEGGRAGGGSQRAKRAERREAHEKFSAHRKDKSKATGVKVKRRH